MVLQPNQHSVPLAENGTVKSEPIETSTFHQGQAHLTNLQSTEGDYGAEEDYQDQHDEEGNEMLQSVEVNRGKMLPYILRERPETCVGTNTRPGLLIFIFYTWSKKQFITINIRYAGFDPGCYEDLQQYVVRTESGYECAFCDDFSHKGRTNVQYHIESKHFPNHFVWNCNICGKQASTKSALLKHNSKFH